MRRSWRIFMFVLAVFLLVEGLVHDDAISAGLGGWSLGVQMMGWMSYRGDSLRARATKRDQRTRAHG